MDFPGIHSILVHPDKPEDITIAVSCGGIWRSDDDGNSWSNIGEGMEAHHTLPDFANDPGTQDVHRLTRCRSNPDQMWLQHHAGIYRSQDVGIHWQQVENVKPSSFGFAVAVHPQIPDTAWFVPEIKFEHRIPIDGRVVVNRTDDGGKSFSSFSNGLPGPMAYDLVFRHALKIDQGGEVLAMAAPRVRSGSVKTPVNTGKPHLITYRPFTRFDLSRELEVSFALVFLSQVSFAGCRAPGAAHRVPRTEHLFQNPPVKVVVMSLRF